MLVSGGYRLEAGNEGRQALKVPRSGVRREEGGYMSISRSCTLRTRSLRHG